jgi:protein TonB
LARDAEADEPVDLTQFTIATGDGQRYAGGQTSSGGESDRAANGPVAADTRGGGGGAVSNLSRPVGIPEAEWSDCAWPQEADALGIDQQTVSMRAIARADGSFESGRIVSDPGHGFGAALLACARRHGFVPALDRGGKPVRAESDVIRFKFTR